MAPPRRIIRKQLEILIDFLESNKDMSKGLPPGSPALYQATKQKWATLAKKLNNVESGTLKAPDGWKKYWFEWRHKCRKKAANARRYQSENNGCSKKGVPLNDLEIRVLELSGAGSVSAAALSTEQLENFLDEDSDMEQKPHHNVEESIFSDMSQKSKELKNGIITDDEDKESHPPKWALRLEERRIAAEERTADALESMAAIMRTQEERRGMLEERIADAMTAIAGTMQDLSSGLQNLLQHTHHLQSSPTDTSMKEVVFL